MAADSFHAVCSISIELEESSSLIATPERNSTVSELIQGGKAAQAALESLGYRMIDQGAFSGHSTV